MLIFDISMCASSLRRKTPLRDGRATVHLAPSAHLLSSRMTLASPRRSLALALTLAACGGATTPIGLADRSRAADQPPIDDDGDAVEAEARSARALGATATFAELVRAARELEDRGEGNATAGCLLRGGGAAGEAWRLEADVAVAVRPLPAAWDDYDAHLRAHRGPARILSRWGQTRAEPYSLALATLTSTVPVDTTLPAAVVVLTDAGAYVLGTAQSGARAAAAVPAARLIEALRALQPGGAPAMIAVTAEAALPLASLREALAVLAELGVPIALAVPLAPDVRLPADPVVSPDVAERGLCGRGLPEPATSAVEGDLAQSVVVAALAPLRDAAARCMNTATGRAASGGRLDVTLRIGADGTVTEACAVRDDVLDPALRICVLEAARALRFPLPNPSGYVDLALPLRLAADATLAQRPLCE